MTDADQLETREDSADKQHLSKMDMDRLRTAIKTQVSGEWMISEGFFSFYWHVSVSRRFRVRSGVGSHEKMSYVDSVDETSVRIGEFMSSSLTIKRARGERDSRLVYYLSNK